MKKFEVKTLLDTAKAATGLSDFGPDDFMEGLEALVNSINQHDSIKAERWDDAFGFFLRLMKNRLWFAQDLKKHPEILEEKLLPPVIILPLPRTGSTKLQRMLGESNSFQSLLYWHMFMFARIPGLENGGAAERLLETREFEQWIYATCPDFIKGHPIFAEEPDEEQILNRFAFRTPMLTTTFYAPEAARWLAQADMSPTYTYMFRQLQYLQWQFHRDDVKPWLLKSPVNVGNEHHLVDIFGRDIKVICPHRDPVNIVCSIIRTSNYSSSLYSNIVPGDDLIREKSRRLLSFLADSATKHIEWRDQNPDIRILDLAYPDINRNTVEVTRKIYEYLDLELTPGILSSVTGWEKDKSRNKFARNTYSAEEFGLTNEQIREEFAPYIERFSEYF